MVEPRLLAGTVMNNTLGSPENSTGASPPAMGMGVNSYKPHLQMPFDGTL